MTAELINHLWQSTLFAIGAGMLTVALRNNSARVRYAIWMSASLKFFIPFSLLMGLGSQPQLAPTAIAIATQTPAASSTIRQVASPFPEFEVSLPSTPPTEAGMAADWAVPALVTLGE